VMLPLLDDGLKVVWYGSPLLADLMRLCDVFALPEGICYVSDVDIRRADRLLSPWENIRQLMCHRE
jgi:hypothetical protein